MFHFSVMFLIIPNSASEPSPRSFFLKSIQADLKVNRARKTNQQKNIWRQGHCAIISFQTVYFHGASPQKRILTVMAFRKFSGNLQSRDSNLTSGGVLSFSREVAQLWLFEEVGHESLLYLLNLVFIQHQVIS